MHDDPRYYRHVYLSFVTGILIVSKEFEPICTLIFAGCCCCFVYSLARYEEQEIFLSGRYI